MTKTTVETSEIRIGDAVYNNGTGDYDTLVRQTGREVWKIDSNGVRYYVRCFDMSNGESIGFEENTTHSIYR